MKESLQKLVALYPTAYKALHGDGLMLGLELSHWPQEHSYFVAHASFHGLSVPLVCGYLLNKCGILTAPVFNHNSVIRIEPNLTVTLTQIDELVDSLIEVGELLTHRKFSSLFSYIINREVNEVNYSETFLSKDPVMPLPVKRGKNLGSFAFLIHPTMDDDLMRIMPESINTLSKEHLALWNNWMQSWFSQRYEPAPVIYAPAVINKQGDYVEGWLISCPLTPDKMMRLKKDKRERLMQQFFEIAENLGVDRVGLGAFTSIITRGGTRLPQRNVDVTTGNGYTGMISAIGLVKAIEARKGSCATSRLAVIGASGAVGRIAAIEASRSFSDITLFGNPSNLSAISGLSDVRAEIVWRALKDLTEGDDNMLAEKLLMLTNNNINVLSDEVQLLLSEANAKNFIDLCSLLEGQYKNIINDCIDISVSIDDDLPKCNAIISATSNGHAFIDSNLLAQNCIVCDAARPADFSTLITQTRPDIYSFEGGIVKLPTPIAFGKSNILGFKPEVNLACLSETIILTMANIKGDFSIGKELEIEQARKVYEFAEKFGFTLPDEVRCPPSALSETTDKKQVELV